MGLNNFLLRYIHIITPLNICMTFTNVLYVALEFQTFCVMMNTMPNLLVLCQELHLAIQLSFYYIYLTVIKYLEKRPSIKIFLYVLMFIWFNFYQPKNSKKYFTPNLFSFLMYIRTYVLLEINKLATLTDRVTFINRNIYYKRLSKITTYSGWPLEILCKYSHLNLAYCR